MKIRILLAILVLTGMTLSSFSLHKHYISLTQIEYNEGEKALQITMRFFIDDLEKAVGKRFDKNLALATEEELKNANAYIERYLDSKFKLWINGTARELLDNPETREDIELEKVENIEIIEVQNSMLMEVYEEQQNYIKLNIGEIKKTFILIKANDKEMLKISSIR